MFKAGFNDIGILLRTTQVSSGEVGLIRPVSFPEGPIDRLCGADINRKSGNWQSWKRILACNGCRASILHLIGPGKGV
jgi:hypothetical protein